jgi:putative glutamine amidotransferase
MPGGADLDPKTYGQEPQTGELYGVNAAQDRADLSLIHYALSRNLPLLTVCRGTQALNVALGGTLQQHIGEAHRNLGHKITLDAATSGQLGMSASGEAVTLTASCHHHQALDDLAPELAVLATSTDGFIEAVRVKGANWAYGVQWHPEDNYKAEAANLDIFKALVVQAQKNEPGHATEPTLFARFRKRATLRRGILARFAQSR